MTLFQSSMPREGDIDGVMNAIQFKLTTEQKNEFDAEISTKEIYDVVFGMGALKALGPDGFQVGF